MSRYRSGPRFTPYELAGRLGMDRPTPEQAAVISAPLERPLLVVAGAGSGKTGTMAARVVWLVANDYVRPEQILGLTFTRKAAGELAHRIRVWLGQLRRRLGGEPTVGADAGAAAGGAGASRPWRLTTPSPPASSPSTGCAPVTSRPPGC